MSSPITATNTLAVADGATVGALVRWFAGLWLNTTWGGFPPGTLLVCATLGFSGARTVLS